MSEEDVSHQDAKPLVVGRYVMCDAIGGGGMAQVHLGRMLGAAGFSRVVAIKRLHPAGASNQDFATMLADEARLASRIRHPNVVPVLDVVRAGRELLLVMEYVHGASLAWLLRMSGERTERLPLPIVARIVLDMLAGLQAAHDAKGERGEPLDLVHRDVSPQNVVVGVDGVARIIDFGIAKAANKLSTTHAGQIKGKLAYMAPEQLRSEPVDRRTDVYAAGLVLWEMLVGSMASSPRATNLPAAVRELLTKKIARPGEHLALPPALDAVVMTALARDRSERFPSADAMATALEAACEPANTKAVAACVATLGHALLAQRSVLVSRVEEVSAVYEAAPEASAARPPAREPTVLASGLDPFPRAPSTHDALPAALPLRSRAPLAILLFTALVVVFVVVGVRLGRPAAKTTSAPSVRPIPPAPTLVEEGDPPSTAEAPIAPGSTAPPPPVLPPHPPSSGPVKPKRIPPDCNPPYAIDSRGIRIPRRECLEE